MTRRDLATQVKRKWPLIAGVALVIVVALFFVSPGLAALFAALLVLGAGVAFWPQTKESETGGQSDSEGQSDNDGESGS